VKEHAHFQHRMPLHVPIYYRNTTNSPPRALVITVGGTHFAVGVCFGRAPYDHPLALIWRRHEYEISRVRKKGIACMIFDGELSFKKITASNIFFPHVINFCQGCLVSEVCNLACLTHLERGSPGRCSCCYTAASRNIRRCIAIVGR